MSSIVNTYLLGYQQKQLLKNTKILDYGAIRLFNDMAPEFEGISTETQREIERNMSRSIIIPTVNSNKLMPTTSQESFNIPMNGNDTGTKTVTFYTTTTGFTMPYAETTDNLLSYQEDFNIKMDRALRSMAADVETNHLAILEANKTQVYTGTASAPGFTFAADTLTVTNAAQKDQFFFRMSYLWDYNRNMPNPRFMASHSAKELLAFVNPYGANNSQNQQNQIVPDMYHSHTLAAGANNVFTGYYVDRGAFKKITNIKKEFADGITAENGKWSRSNVAMPFLDSEVMIYTEEAKADLSTFNANTSQHFMSKIVKFLLVYRWCIATRYIENLATDVSPVLKVIGTLA